MTELEATLVERIQHLNAEQQAQVLSFLDTLAPVSFDFAAWQAGIDRIHAQMGQGVKVNVQQSIDELRNNP